MKRPLMIALLLCVGLTGPALATMPEWMSGAWRTNARLTAPDGAQLRIRCTLDATSQDSDSWGGVLGCATVQGRFESRWEVAVTGQTASGDVRFSGPEEADMAVRGTMAEDEMALSSEDGQAVRFRPGADGAIVVEMQALGPQRLSGAITFEPR